jgi:O-antigen biosynthesis protein WbqP
LRYSAVKRGMDFILSLVGLLILSPVFLILIMAIKVDSKGPILFKQKRVGKNRPLNKLTDRESRRAYFSILKFRTMIIDTPKDTPTHLLANPEQCITKVGKFLRKTSLDELPQIINILTGDMSIIGPRPALWNQYDLIEERDKYGANDVVPGLSGWAQINGRDELPIEVKAKLDGEYVEKVSFAFDCKCFFGTIISVLKREGVVEGGMRELEREKELASAKESMKG